MKKSIQIFVVLLSAIQVFAFTPHINKGSIEEISLSQAIKEMKISETELKELHKEFFGYFEIFDNFPELEKIAENSKYMVYKQSFAETNEKLYRVFFETCDMYNEQTKNLFQKIYYSNGTSPANLLFADYYDGLVDYLANSFSKVHLHTNVMPIIKNKKLAGIMLYGIESYTRYSHTDEYTSINEIAQDKITHKAEVFFKDDFSKVDLRFGANSDVSIECSKPLIDEKDTFKYTIQNAFDKNPATSYVEDTDDDLMYIRTGWSYKDTSGKSLRIKNLKLAVINGYAKNELFYKNNNRIKGINGDVYSNGELLFEHKETILLEDSNLKYQIFDWSPRASFTVQNVYGGEKYNDTCIAEVDYYIENIGWLFGGVN